MEKHIDIDRLLVDYRDGNLSREAREELRAWAKLSPANRQLLELLDDASGTREELAEIYEHDKEGAWKKIQAAAHARDRRRFRRFATRGIAAAVLLAAIGLLLLTRDGENREGLFSGVIAPGSSRAYLRLSDGSEIGIGGAEGVMRLSERDCTRIEAREEVIVFDADESRGCTPVQSEIIVPQGGEFSLVLSDGSRVWLNSGSSIRFPSRFSRDAREVSLSGEAYFEVSPDAGRPFAVEVRGERVTVLGTSFNISAYDDDEKVITTLVTGSILLETGKERLRLLPGQQARLAPSTGKISLHEVDATAYIAWTRGAFVFFDESVAGICRILSRWYRVEIDATAPGLEALRYSGIIKREETFNKVAEFLDDTDEIIFVERAGKVIVLPK
ncbi:MAG: FecR domain-containing protein [Odoribacteraceae bacterium]|jgi:ferric-dicitrate binding protein FerR (iron transport regulator)|nr:FecR domain-containing protein [Odoribacteraceae bacterium]